MKRAFTLIELLIVIAIIGILASVIVISLSDQSGEAEKNKSHFNVAQAARFVAIQAANRKTDETELCPPNTIPTQTDKIKKEKLYCRAIIASGELKFFIYEIFEEIGASSTDNVYCMNENSGSPKLANLKTNGFPTAATPGATEVCTEGADLSTS